MPPRIPLFLALAVLEAAPALAQDSTLLGFTPEATTAERQLESRFDALLEADDLQSWMQELTDQPFYLGSPGARENATFLADRFREWGYETRIETYQVLSPRPRSGCSR